MAKINLQHLLKCTKNVSVKHGPVILTAVGIIGMAVATIEAVKATPKALQKIDEKKQEVFESTDPIDVPMCASYQDVKLTKKEIIECTWKLYLRAAVAGVAGVACIIASDKISLGRTAAAFSMYDTAQKSLKKYQDSTLKIVGEEKAAEIQQEVDKSHFEPKVIGNLKPLETGYGDTLCYDVIGDRYFYSDLAVIRMQLAELTEQMLSGYDDEPCLNQAYAAMGLPGIVYGDRLGWSVQCVRQIVLDSDGLVSKVRPEDGKPYIVIDFGSRPNSDYLSAHMR